MKLVGYSYEKDEFIQKRLILENSILAYSFQNFFSEIIEDILDDVKTSPAPLPDTNDPVIRKQL